MTAQCHLNRRAGSVLTYLCTEFSYLYANGTGSIACAQLLILVLTGGPSLGFRVTPVAPFSLLAKAWQGTTRVVSVEALW